MVGPERNLEVEFGGETFALRYTPGGWKVLMDELGIAAVSNRVEQIFHFAAAPDRIGLFLYAGTLHELRGKNETARRARRREIDELVEFASDPWSPVVQKIAEALALSGVGATPEVGETTGNPPRLARTNGASPDSSDSPLES